MGSIRGNKMIDSNEEKRLKIERIDAAINGLKKQAEIMRANAFALVAAGVAPRHADELRGAAGIVDTWVEELLEKRNKITKKGER